MLTLAVLHSPALAQAPAEVRVGTSGTANTVLAIWMADDAGLYAKHNLKVTLSNMGGGSRGAAEVRAGKLDVMHVGLSSVVQLNQQGRGSAHHRLARQHHPLRLLHRARA